MLLQFLIKNSVLNSHDWEGRQQYLFGQTWQPGVGGWLLSCARSDGLVPQPPPAYAHIQSCQTPQPCAEVSLLQNKRHKWASPKDSSFLYFSDTVASIFSLSIYLPISMIPCPSKNLPRKVVHDISKFSFDAKYWSTSLIVSLPSYTLFTRHPHLSVSHV